MAEQHDLTTPVTITTNNYKLTFMTINSIAQSVSFNVSDNNGNVIGKTYDASTTPTGATVIHSLNTGNFTVTSMTKTILQRLATDGVIPPGSVSGTPA